MTAPMTLEQHAEAILEAADGASCLCDDKNCRDCALILAACQALRDEGRREGLEAAAKVADDWRDENRKNVSKARHANMSDMLEGAALGCNALAHEFRKIDPAKLGEG